MARGDRESVQQPGPLHLERDAWAALATDGASAAAFFTRVLADEILMLLPNGRMVDDRAEAIQLMSGVPWSSYELQDAREFVLATHCAAVAYRVEARRGDTEYSALVSSTYSYSDGAWRMALHQQTPI